MKQPHDELQIEDLSELAEHERREPDREAVERDANMVRSADLRPVVILTELED